VQLGAGDSSGQVVCLWDRVGTGHEREFKRNLQRAVPYPVFYLQNFPLKMVCFGVSVWCFKDGIHITLYIVHESNMELFLPKFSTDID